MSYGRSARTFFALVAIVGRLLIKKFYRGRGGGIYNYYGLEISDWRICPEGISENCGVACWYYCINSMRGFFFTSTLGGGGGGGGEL